MIVGIFGASGAGKDTLARGLIAQGVDAKIYKFAEPIKKMAAAYLGVKYEDVDGITHASRSFVTKPHPLLYATTFPKDILTPRQFMQWLGTDIFRDGIDVHVWSNHLRQRIAGDDCDALITDGRFADVFDTIRTKWRGKCVLVQRRGAGGDGHASEAVPYQPKDYDAVLQNNGSVEDLVRAGAKALGYELRSTK